MTTHEQPTEQPTLIDCPPTPPPPLVVTRARLLDAERDLAEAQYAVTLAQNEVARIEARECAGVGTNDGAQRQNPAEGAP